MKILLWIVSSMLLASCVVGPNFKTPLAPQTQAYTEKPLAMQTAKGYLSASGSQTQVFVSDQSLPETWWQLFHSPAIDQLVKQGIANNPNLQSLQATLKQAAETLYAQEETLLIPGVDANLNSARQRFANVTIGDAGSDVFNLFNASVKVGYTFDLFGGVRRQLEATAATVDYSRYMLVGGYLSLTANIVTTAITIAALQDELQTIERLIHIAERQLHIMNQQFALGSITQENILAQQNQLAVMHALAPPVQKQLFLSKHALAVLLGELPSDSTIPTLTLQTIQLPHRLPISVPSRLVERRPDIQAQSALLHQASANIGVARANLFPTITLNATYGWVANVMTQLLSPTTATWSVGGAMLQPVFHGGALRATQRAAVAAYDAAFALYRQTVLQAFGNVADTLRALEADARYLRTQDASVIATQQTWQLTLKQFRLGAVSELTVLNAETQYRQALLNQIQVSALRYNDTVALFQALGGGWWNHATTEVK